MASTGRRAYTLAMTNALSVLLLVALIAIVAVLLFGVFAMARGGEFNRKYGNLLMRWRIGLQLAAVALLILFFLFGRG